MNASIKIVLAVLAGLTASALARFAEGPSPADTYTDGFIYWLRYSGFDFGVIIAGLVWLVTWKSPNRASIAATGLLTVTIVAAVLSPLCSPCSVCSASNIAMFGVTPIADKGGGRIVRFVPGAK